MVTGTTARMWCLQTPGTGEGFYRQASDPVVEGVPATALDLERLRAAAVATGAIVIMGLPPFLGAGPPTGAGGSSPR